MLPFFVFPTLCFLKKFNVCIKEGDKNIHHPYQCLDWEIPPLGY